MRAFLTLKAGTGARTDPFRPAATITGNWASWDLEHPDTNEVLGYVVLSDMLTAPVDCLADLGDPTDKASMQSTPISNAAADTIAAMLGINRNRVRGMTGYQIIRFLNRTQPVMAASWGDTIAELITETDG